MKKTVLIVIRVVCIVGFSGMRRCARLVLAQ